MGGLAFQQNLPNHSLKNGLDEAMSTEWAGLFWRVGSPRER